MWFKGAELLLILVPWLIEILRRKRNTGEKAVDYVRRKQDEKLKVTELLLAEDGEKLSRLAYTRQLLTRELLNRRKQLHNKSSKPPAG